VKLTGARQLIKSEHGMRWALLPLPTNPEMAQHLFEVSPPPFPEPERWPWEEGSANHGSISAVDRSALIVDSEDKAVRNFWRRRWVPRPTVAVFIILIMITGISFAPALLSNAKPFDYIVFDGVTADTDGVRFSGSISLDGSID
jgi:hypothetical protein